MRKKHFRSCFFVFLLIAVFFGCSQTGDDKSSLELTSEDVNNGARGTILAGMISVVSYLNYSENNAATLEGLLPGLDITEGSTTVTFAYTEVQADLNDDSSAEFVISGTFVVSDNGATITFTDFTIANAANTSETHTVNGSISLSGDDTKIVISAFSFSGSLVSNTLIIATTMSMSKGQAPVISAAIINGKEYLSEFNTMVSTLSES